MTPANDNEPRPKWYDDKVMSHRPIIAWMARKFVEEHEVDEFIQDVYVLAFYRYSNFNPEYAFSTWLGMLSRNVAAERRRVKLTKMRSGKHIDIADIELSVPATQEEIVSIRQALDAIPEGRDKDVMLRHAMGEQLADIGRDMGIGRERARQLEERARLNMGRRLAVGAMVRHLQEAA